jgi:DNA-binding beta-propeller fold protein YncE
MEEVLGIKPLGLNDALQPPMSEVFSTHQATWSYKAQVPEILRTTKLPLPVATAEDRPGVIEPGHDATYWADKTKNFDFTVEDKLDSESFNMVLWKGIKGESQPYPSERDGRDLSKHRDALLRELRKSKNR